MSQMCVLILFSTKFTHKHLCPLSIYILFLECVQHFQLVFQCSYNTIPSSLIFIKYGYQLFFSSNSSLGKHTKLTVAKVSIPIDVAISSILSSYFFTASLSLSVRIATSTSHMTLNTRFVLKKDSQLRALLMLNV